jgi:streptomycin 6-kinase
MTSSRRFPPPWRVEQTPGGLKVLDASGQALVYVYARETRAEADIAKVLTFDEARRIAVNVAKAMEAVRPPSFQIPSSL